MIAGLSEFTEGKNAYTLHLNMAQECMRLFQERKLVEVASVEQVQVHPLLFEHFNNCLRRLTCSSHFPQVWTKITGNLNILPIS